MLRKTEDGGRKTVFGPGSPVAFARRLARDNEGQALLETLVAFPVLLFFMFVVMELSMLYNAKQLANYAAFSAARTAAVRGVNDTTSTHLAAAMAMSSIAATTSSNAHGILLAYDVPEPDSIVKYLCAIPGFNGQTAEWKARLANAYVRTGEPVCAVDSIAGRRRHIEVDVVYIHRCDFIPIGFFWGMSGVTAYVNALPPAVKAFATGLQTPRNIRIRGHAVMDYWAN
jgi:hypothetical protein